MYPIDLLRILAQIKVQKNWRLPLILIALEGLVWLFLLTYSPQTGSFFLFHDAKKEKILTEISAFQGKTTRSEIFIKDLKKGSVYAQNDLNYFPSASIYKLAIMYKAFDEIENGTLQKNTTLTASKKHLDEVLETKQTEPDEEISYPVDLAIKLMIRISDNYSAILLAEKLGWVNIQNFLENQNIRGFKLLNDESPQTTAFATAQILEKIYRGQAVSKAASEDMKEILLTQQVNDRIPKYLENIKVAHKTGELGNIRNDAGIVFGKKSDYIFVFFTESEDPEETSEAIAQTSQKIFNILEN